MRPVQGFATYRCYHARGCGTASPRLTSSTTPFPSRAAYWRSWRGTSHSASSCNIWCTYPSIRLRAIRFRALRPRTERPQDGCTLRLVVHYRNMVDMVSDLASSNLVPTWFAHILGFSIRRTQIRAISVLSLASSSVLFFSAILI